MRWVTSTKPAKGENTKLGTKDNKGEVVPMELSTQYDYPQYETVSELVSSAGGEQKLLKWANGKIKAAVKQAVVNALTGNDGAKGKDGAVNDAIAAGKAWSIANARERGTGVNAKADFFDTLLARKRNGEEISDEDWQSALAQFGA